MEARLFDLNQDKLEELLAAQKGLEHLHVKKRGKSLTIYSGNGHAACDHAKLTEIEQRTWGLSLPQHSGRWERTPFIGSMEEVVADLVDNFWFLLQQNP